MGRLRGLIKPGSAMCLLSWIAVGTVHAEVLTFRQGVQGYAGAVDTFVQEVPSGAGADNGAVDPLGWDDSDPSGYDTYTLIRFEDIIGPGAVPPGAEITEATLYLTVFDPGDHGRVHRVLLPWVDSDSFNTFCGSGCEEGLEFAAQEHVAAGTLPGEIAVSVTASVQAWSDGAPNHGWIIRPQFGGGDGTDVYSSEHVVAPGRPRLEIRYGEGPPPITLQRGPYLQQAAPTAMTVKWRTGVPVPTAIFYGSDPALLEESFIDPEWVTDHVVEIGGLEPETLYYYAVGFEEVVLAGADPDHFFITSPPVGADRGMRIWVVGDSGNGELTPGAVREAMVNWVAGATPDLFLHLGDMAYESGTDDELTLNFFGMYPGVLINTPYWPTFGNHEGVSSDSPSATGPYYDAFELPRAGESGGLASGTEAYYSFDRGHIHFICMNSHDISRQPGSAMLTWLEQDLAQANQDWIIAYWHHPPYSLGSHNSNDAFDSKGQMPEMREHVVPILEAGGVDLVLSGHSHTYERSFLIKGAYGYGTAPHFATPSFDTLSAGGHILDDGDGAPDGDGSYVKFAGQVRHQGAVYVVAGHGGTETSQIGEHPVMAFTENDNGSCIIDIQEGVLTLTNIRQDGAVTDTFSLVKLACTSDADCADGVFCNGAEYCDAGGACRLAAGPCPGQACSDDLGLCVPLSCNDGECQAGENCVNCAADCPSAPGASCGNSVCEIADGEDCLNCPADCNGEQNGPPGTRFCCGGGAGQGPVGCADDRCTAADSQCADQPVFAYCCGDRLCQAGEDSTSCPIDCGPPGFCDDGVINASDLASLLGHWGPCPGCVEDLNQDGTIAADDLALLLGSWGPCRE